MSSKETYKELIEAYLKYGHMTVEVRGLLSDLITDGLDHDLVLHYQDRHFVIHDLYWTWVMFEVTNVIDVDLLTVVPFEETLLSTHTIECVLCGFSTTTTGLPLGWQSRGGNWYCPKCICGGIE